VLQFSKMIAHASDSLQGGHSTRKITSGEISIRDMSRIGAAVSSVVIMVCSCQCHTNFADYWMSFSLFVVIPL
jgi:hypothetical protein